LSSFRDDFHALTGYAPLDWQARLYADFFAKGVLPSAVDVPTGLGKTMVMVLWLIARAREGARGAKLPRRLVYVVDRRAVVDQATAEAEKLREALEGAARDLKALLKLDGKLPISTLRGAFVGNRAWLDDPAGPAIIVGTVDMIGSRLLFGGYGVSRKMRPFHAGLLGVDTLVVLDEAHLVPPFAHLLKAIERDGALWPKDAADRAMLPPFAVLPLSATQTAEAGDTAGAGRMRRAEPFRLEPADWLGDGIARERLNAHKRLTLRELDGKGADAQLAEEAWRLATEDGPKRVVVFCNRRGGSKGEDGAGPSAEGVQKLLEERVKKEFKGREGEAPDIELLVGARRVREREAVKVRLKALGFIGGSDRPEKPAFLIATSAGEVGVDIDAGHMVSDLVSWERMVQRLGRVNRRGKGAAEVIVFDGSALEKDEARKAQLAATRALLERVAAGGEAGASPMALRVLADDAGAEAIRAASTPEPLRPGLSRPLVDAWAMTSLERHTGRPEIAPWLRGWVDEVPQTALVWRAHLPVRADDGAARVTDKEINAFFEAAPIHESEVLETETYRVSDWLEKLFKAPRWRKAQGAEREADADIEQRTGEEVPEAAPDKPLRPRDIAAFVLGRDGEVEDSLSLEALSAERKGPVKDRFERQLAGKTLVLDARIGGLDEKGMLSAETATTPAVADKNSEAWIPEQADEPYRAPGFQIRDDRVASDKNWLFRAKFLRKAADDADAQQWLFIFKWRISASTEDDRSIVKTQTLADHSSDTERQARSLGERLGLPTDDLERLATAAFLHDIGKARPLWQRAMAGSDYKGETLAKTDGKHAQPQLLKIGNGTFRHEFASVIDAGERDDLILHLIAAHHGFARPVIFAGDPGNPPSVTEDTARAVAMRFARLQKRWGPWGLAWWESLLRAADQRASRALEAAPENQGGEG
jgi:CRISPR-associated endonuclease/helicase Cas3